MDINWKWKAGAVAALLVILAVMGYIIKVQYDSLARQKDIETSVVDMKKLSDEIVRNHAQYATRDDLEKFAKSNGVDLSPIQDDLKKLQANVQAISVIKVITPGKDQTNIPSSGTGETNPAPTAQDKYGYLNAEKTLKLQEPFSDKLSVPWGSVGFSAWKEDPWALHINPREYRTSTVIATDESGRHFVYTQMSVITDGKTYLIPIANADLVETYPAAKFSWNPLLLLGLEGGAVFAHPIHPDLVPTLGVSLFSYGKTKLSPSWIFLGLGLGYEAREGTASFLLSPIGYNLNGIVSFLHNTYVAPSVSFDTSGNLGVMLGVQVGL